MNEERSETSWLEAGVALLRRVEALEQEELEVALTWRGAHAVGGGPALPEDARLAALPVERLSAAALAPGFERLRSRHEAALEALEALDEEIVYQGEQALAAVVDSRDALALRARALEALELMPLAALVAREVARVDALLLAHEWALEHVGYLAEGRLAAAPDSDLTFWQRVPEPLLEEPRRDDALALEPSFDDETLIAVCQGEADPALEALVARALDHDDALLARYTAITEALDAFDAALEASDQAFDAALEASDQAFDAALEASDQALDAALEASDQAFDAAEDAADDAGSTLDDAGDAVRTTSAPAGRGARPAATVPIPLRVLAFDRPRVEARRRAQTRGLAAASLPVDAQGRPLPGLRYEAPPDDALVFVFDDGSRLFRLVERGQWVLLLFREHPGEGDAVTGSAVRATWYDGRLLGALVVAGRIDIHYGGVRFPFRLDE